MSNGNTPVANTAAPVPTPGVGAAGSLKVKLPSHFKDSSNTLNRASSKF